MKRALLLSYHVPPRAGIAAVRVGQLIVVLRRYGWEVVPVTPDLGDVAFAHPVVTTGVVDFKRPVRELFGVRGTQTTSAHFGTARAAVAGKASLKTRAIRLGYDVTEYANRQFGWLGPGTRAITELLRTDRFNAVISSSPPETTHLVASRIHGTLPWIADLRDPWLREGMRARRPPLNAIDRLLEPRVLRGASAITTVSEPLADALRARYPRTAIHSVPNAFSESDWAEIPFTQPERTTFLYAGQLYGGRADPRPFFRALREAVAEGSIQPHEVVVDFYGDDSEWLGDEVRSHAIESMVRIFGKRPRAEILRLERAASRLLMFLWNDPNERGTYSGKLFEYLGARRPILALGGPDDTVIDPVLERTGAGVRVRSVESIRAAIVDAVRQWRSGVTPVVDPAAVQEYESDHLGKRFAEILETATARQGGARA